MSLKGLIQRIEENKWKETDYENPISRSILEELSNGENDALQKQLFENIRKLNDEIIADYLQLDRCYKILMAKAHNSILRNEKDYQKLKEFGLSEYHKNKSGTI